MIKKVVCPTDFSKAANNATEYAAKLAQILGAEILFVNVQRIMPVAAAVSLAGGIGEQVRENSLFAAKQLKELSAEVNRMFKISADYEVDVTTKSLEKTLTSVEPNDTMIVMGTNGVDDQYQYFFGTNTYQVIKKTKCPVLVIPESVSFGSIQKFVFAWDYRSVSSLPFTILEDIMKAFNPQFYFLHVSKNRTSISQDIFRVLRVEVASILGEEAKVDFKQIYSDDIPEAIRQYIIESEADMLGLTYYDRSWMGNIFRSHVTKQLSETAEFPILIMHA